MFDSLFFLFISWPITQLNMKSKFHFGFDKQTNSEQEVMNQAQLLKTVPRVHKSIKQ